MYYPFVMIKANEKHLDFFRKKIFKILILSV